MNTPRMVPRVLLVTAVLSVAPGCSYLLGDDGLFPDTSQDYRKARELPELEVPEDGSREALQQAYPVPQVATGGGLGGEFEVPRPAPLSASATQDAVRIQSLGDDSWALVSIGPGQLWPQVRAFLASAGIAVSRADAEAGLIETGWIELEGQPMASRFRFRIEQGVQRGSSELHVLQMNQAGDTSRWPEASDDSGQEGEMLRSVAQYVANSADSSPVSMIADRAMSSQGRIALREGPGGDHFIELGLPFDRAWASVGKALEDSRFEVTDRDRSAGRYYIRYLGAADEEERGWFASLFGSEDDDPLIGRDLLLSVREEGQREVSIRLEAQAAPALEQRQARELLSLLQGNIN